MALIHNTLVFLDTAFFKKYSDRDRYAPDFLKYCRDGKIALVTSHICLEEWRSQKVQHLNDYLASANSSYNSQTSSNPIADEILAPYRLRHPDQEEIDENSQRIVSRFVEANGIIRYMPTDQHIERTWRSYFRGFPPFKARKNAKDIPDSWIYEAAKDVRFHEDYEHIENKFSIGGDEFLNKHLKKLGLKPITVIELLELLKQEEAGVNRPVEALATDRTAVAVPVAVDEITSLDEVLNGAMTDEMRQIYIRLLGYTHYLNNPGKEQLFTLIERRGFNPELIKAAAALLSQPSLELLQDTGNHILPTNRAICEEAGNLITAEIIEHLE